MYNIVENGIVVYWKYKEGIFSKELKVEEKF